MLLATDYAEWYKIAPQAEGEPDRAFQSRVAGALRDMGNVIEAHEAQSNSRYEDGGNTAHHDWRERL